MTTTLTGRLSARVGMQFDTAPSLAAFGPTWRTRTELTYRLPGRIELTAGVVGRRGYELPLFMTESAGGEAIPFVSNTPLLDTTRRPVLWDTVLRAEKHLFTAGRVDASLVAEVHNLMNVNRKHDRKPLTPTLTSRVNRFGLKFRF